jgi:uracil-DNA glycosylase family 4
VIEQPAMTPDRNCAARELLAFYVEAGVDALVGETPVDRFAGEAREEPPGGRPSATIDRAAGAPPPRPDGLAATLAARGLASGGESRAQAAPAPSAPSPPSPDAAAMAARTAATRAATLDELRAILDGFDGCALKNTAKQLVFADGNPQARVMFVGEAPGREEDLEGLPFVGRSGQLLDRMMAAIGLDRSGAYIANVIPWRPPGNRTPTPQETAICLPFIRRQIELADPDVLVCLGNPSAQTLLGVKDGIMKTRGRWFPYHTGTREIRAIATFHPAYLLRQPLQKRLAWRDFLAIKQALGGASGE